MCSEMRAPTSHAGESNLEIIQAHLNRAIEVMTTSDEEEAPDDASGGENTSAPGSGKRYALFAELESAQCLASI